MIPWCKECKAYILSPKHILDCWTMKTVDELLKDLADSLRQLRNEDTKYNPYLNTSAWDKAQQLIGQIRWQLERENGQ